MCKLGWVRSSGFGPHLLLVVGLGVNFGDVRGAISENKRNESLTALALGTSVEDE